MEILILLAGEQIGPFSEQRVREYLEQGLVTPTDLAIAEGMTEWQAVDYLLAHLSAGSAAELPSLAATTETALPHPDILPSDATSTTTSLEALMQSMTAAQKAKRKLGKIVIQPILPIDTTASASSKTETGKLPFEPARSTTSLPSLSALPPKAKSSGKIPLLAGHILSRPASPEMAPAKEKTPPASPPPLPKKKKAPGISSLRTFGEIAKKIAGKPCTWLRSREVVYAVIGLAVLILILIFLSWGVIASHRSILADARATMPSPQPAVPVNSDKFLDPAFVPRSAADFSDRGIARQARGDLDGAITDFNSAVAIDPKNVVALYRRGLARQAQDDRTNAMADFSEVIRLSPRDADAYSNRAFLKQCSNDPDGALADYAQALVINSKLPKAYYNVGLIRMQKGDLEGAVDAYSQAIAVNPQMDRAYYNRGTAKSTQGNMDGAIADYTQALVLNPKLALAYRDRGFARQSKGDTAGALSDYSQAILLDPKLSGTYYNRALIREQLGDLDGAMTDSTKAIELDPKNAQAYFNRGMARFGRGYFDSALADLKKMEELAPRDDDTDNARLYVWLISTQENPKGKADAELAESLQNDWNSPPEDPVSKIAAFLVGRLSEADLVAVITSPDPAQDQERRGKVWYFVGMKKLFMNDVATAVQDFHKCIAIGKKDSNEYLFAQMELQTLAQTQPWSTQP
jgi:tetratricopeptide (TPR) repeat protein